MAANDYFAPVFDYTITNNMRKLRKQFDGLGLADILSIILQNSKKSDLAMWYILNIRMKLKLSKRYEQFKSVVSLDYADILGEFFLYLRDGKNDRNIRRYESLHRIRDIRTFGRWMSSTFTYYLVNIAGKDHNKRLVSLEGGRIMQRPLIQEEFLDYERRVKIAAKVIAYVYQKLNVENRIILMSWLMGKYKKDCPHSTREIAALIGISDISFRVKVHHIFKMINSARTQLMTTGELPLNGEHLRLSETIEESFNDLSPLFLRYYELNLFIKTGGAMY